MSIKKQRIIIHAGPGKTGSSAIQAWLTKNTKILESKGVYYPKHNLSKDKISSGNLREILTQNELGKWQVDSEKVVALISRFKKSNFSILLLSSEYFFHQILNIQKAIPEAEYIAYVRNPVELLESNYNQSVKRHSNSKPFAAPNELNNFFWHYLESVFKKVENNKLYLRPFDKSLMQDGNIVVDLLSVMGVKLDNKLEDKRVNSSFTFQCMEFKRLLNHFGLGPLEQQLDEALQNCGIGERVYSLIPPDKFQALNSESCQRMANFIEQFSQLHLIPLLESFKTSQQKQFLKQKMTLLQLTEVADYIKKDTPSLYKKLKSLVENNPSLVVNNNAIFELFSVTHQPINKQELISDLLLKHINQFTVVPVKREKICYELACFYHHKNDLENAFMFAKGAYFFNPKNQLFIEKLNELIKQINSRQRVNPVVRGALEKASSLYRFRRLLRL